MKRDEMLAAAIRRLRLARGWDLIDAAEGFRRDPSAVSRWETKRRPPPLPSQIARAFDVSIEEVLRPCPRCGYRPPLGYMCLTCRTEGKSKTMNDYPKETDQGLVWACCESSIDQPCLHKRSADVIGYLATFAKKETIQEAYNRERGIGQPSHFWRKGAYLHALGAAILYKRGEIYFVPDEARLEGEKYLAEHDAEIKC